MKKLWFKAAAIRAIKTMAQAGLALITAAGAQMIEDIDPKALLSVMALAGLASILTSLIGLPEVDPAEADDAYEDDVEPVTMEELDELDNDIEETEDEEN